MKNELLFRLADGLQKKGFPFWKILLTALLLRVCWALLISVYPVSDSNAYDIFALNIWEHSTFGWKPEEPNAYWPVGTSSIYAALYAVFGHVYWPIVVFNILIGVGIVLFGMRICREFFGDTAGSFCGLLLALWPSQILYVTVLASELPFTFLTLAAFDIWISDNRRIVVRSFLIGILLAGASYIRPLAVLLPFIYAVSLAVREKNTREHLGIAIISFSIICLLIAPWTYRNYQLYNAFVLISTNGPTTLWMGNHPGTNGSYAALPDQVKSLNDYERSQVLGKMAKDYIREHPFEFIYRTTWKLLKLHAYETIAVNWNLEGIRERFGERVIIPLKIMTQGYWFVVLFTALLGLYILFRREKFICWMFHPIILPWAYYSIVHSIIVVQDRYHFPSIPFIAALAVLPLTTLIQKSRNTRFSK